MKTFNQVVGESKTIYLRSKNLNEAVKRISLICQEEGHSLTKVVKKLHEILTKKIQAGGRR